eukprot:13036266-Alexandrium_andersonii.AAC.1
MFKAPLPLCRCPFAAARLLQRQRRRRALAATHLKGEEPDGERVPGRSATAARLQAAASNRAECQP